ncbi:MAG: hypothetical protein OEM99_18090 [Gammaproteobacteria bacterium]|nr:hypothetical protein [Gammaproteobacteria bacterium]
MKRIDLGQTINTLANVGVLAGIIFLAYELRQNTLATELVAAQGHLEATLNANQQMVAHPHLAELVARGIEGDEFSRVEELQLNNGYSTQLRAWQNSHYQYERGALDEAIWQGYSNNIADNLVGDAHYEMYWREHMDWFTPTFNEFVELKLADRRLK